MEPCTFQHKLEEIKKIHPEKISYNSGNGHSEKHLIFSQKKAVLIFQKTELPYFSGNRNPEKLLIFQQVTFRDRKIKKTHFEKTSYISENGTLKSQAKSF